MLCLRQSLQLGITKFSKSIIFAKQTNIITFGFKSPIIQIGRSSIDLHRSPLIFFVSLITKGSGWSLPHYAHPFISLAACLTASVIAPPSEAPHLHTRRSTLYVMLWRECSVALLLAHEVGPRLFILVSRIKVLNLLRLSFFLTLRPLILTCASQG